jgi:hypothetical protein
LVITLERVTIRYGKEQTIMTNTEPDFLTRLRAHPDFPRMEELMYELYRTIDTAHLPDREHERRNDGIEMLCKAFTACVFEGEMTFDEFLEAIEPAVQELKKQGVPH